MAQAPFSIPFQAWFQDGIMNWCGCCQRDDYDEFQSSRDGKNVDGEAQLVHNLWEKRKSEQKAF